MDLPPADTTNLLATLALVIAIGGFVLTALYTHETRKQVKAAFHPAIQVDLKCSRFGKEDAYFLLDLQNLSNSIAIIDARFVISFGNLPRRGRLHPQWIEFYSGVIHTLLPLQKQEVRAPQTNQVPDGVGGIRFHTEGIESFLKREFADPTQISNPSYQVRVQINYQSGISAAPDLSRTQVFILRRNPTNITDWLVQSSPK